VLFLNLKIKEGQTHDAKAEQLDKIKLADLHSSSATHLARSGKGGKRTGNTLSSPPTGFCR
jgi:hypothetical protein